MFNKRYIQKSNFNLSSSFLICDAPDFFKQKVLHKRTYSSTKKPFADPISLLGMFSKTASDVTAFACTTPSAMYPDINLQSYIASFV